MILSLIHMADDQDDVTRCLCARRKHNEAHRFLRPCDAKQAPVDEPGASPARACIADCGMSGGMDFNSMPAPKYLVATEHRDSWVRLLAMGRGPLRGGRPKSSIAKEAWRNASRSNRRARAGKT